MQFDYQHRMREMMPGGPPAPPQRHSSPQLNGYQPQGHSMPPSRSSESSSLRSGGTSMDSKRSSSDSTKPRLTREQHGILESKFNQQSKPTTASKKTIAENLGVPLEKVNNWFQNRRAKVKQQAKNQNTNTNTPTWHTHPPPNMTYGVAYPHPAPMSYGQAYSQYPPSASTFYPVAVGPEHVPHQKFEADIPVDRSMPIANAQRDMLNPYEFSNLQNPAFFGFPGGEMDNEFAQSFALQPIQEEGGEASDDHNMGRGYNGNALAVHANVWEPQLDIDQLGVDYPPYDAGNTTQQTWGQNALNTMQQPLNIEPHAMQNMAIRSQADMSHGHTFTMGNDAFNDWQSQPSYYHQNLAHQAPLPTIPSQPDMSYTQSIRAPLRQDGIMKRKTDSPHDEEPPVEKHHQLLRRQSSTISNVTNEIGQLDMHHSNGSDTSIPAPPSSRLTMGANGNSIRKGRPAPLQMNGARTPSYNNSAAPSPRTATSTERLRSVKSASHLNGGRITKTAKKEPSPVTRNFKDADLPAVLNKSRSMSNIHSSKAMRGEEPTPDVPIMPAQYQGLQHRGFGDEEIVPASSGAQFSNGQPMDFAFQNMYVESPLKPFDPLNGPNTLHPELVDGPFQVPQQFDPQHAGAVQVWSLAPTMIQNYGTGMHRDPSHHSNTSQHSSGSISRSLEAPPVQQMMSQFDSRIPGLKTPSSPNRSFTFQSYNVPEGVKVPDSKKAPRHREDSIKLDRYEFVHVNASPKTWDSSPASSHLNAPPTQ